MKSGMPISYLSTEKLNTHFSHVVTTITDMSTQLTFPYKNTLLFGYIANLHHSNHLIHDDIHLYKQNGIIQLRHECETTGVVFQTEHGSFSIVFGPGVQITSKCGSIHQSCKFSSR
jgi:hypothetical protein